MVKKAITYYEEKLSQEIKADINKSIKMWEYIKKLRKENTCSNKQISISKNNKLVIEEDTIHDPKRTEKIFTKDTKTS